VTGKHRQNDRTSGTHVLRRKQSQINSSVQSSQTKRCRRTHSCDDPVRHFCLMGSSLKGLKHFLLNIHGQNLSVRPTILASGRVKKPIAVQYREQTFPLQQKDVRFSGLCNKRLMDLQANNPPIGNNLVPFTIYPIYSANGHASLEVSPQYSLVVSLYS